jgi:hypothetical protein
MERGNAKHSPREDDMLAAELSGTLGPHASNREEWADPEPPADDDAPVLLGPSLDEQPLPGGDAPAPADGAGRPHDLDVANDWHSTES